MQPETDTETDTEKETDSNTTPVVLNPESLQPEEEIVSEAVVTPENQTGQTFITEPKQEDLSDQGAQVISANTEYVSQFMKLI